MKYLIISITALVLANCGQNPPLVPLTKTTPTTNIIVSCSGYNDYNYSSLIDLSQLKPNLTFGISGLQINSSSNPLPNYQGANSQFFAISCLTTLSVPYSTIYTIQAQADNGVRLFLNEVQLFNQSNINTSPVTPSWNGFLEAGSYQLQLDFFNNSGPYSLELNWQYNGQPMLAIPNTSLSNPINNQIIE